MVLPLLLYKPHPHEQSSHVQEDELELVRRGNLQCISLLTHQFSDMVDRTSHVHCTADNGRQADAVPVQYCASHSLLGRRHIYARYCVATPQRSGTCL